MRAQLDRPTRSHTFPKDLRQQQEDPIQKAKQAEETRQKYAIDRIGEANPFLVSWTLLKIAFAESAIKSIHKIWPETQEPEYTNAVNAVTSDECLHNIARPPSLAPHRSRLLLLRIESIADHPISSKSPGSSPGSGNKRKRSADPDDSTTHGLIKTRSVSGFKDNGSDFNVVSRPRYRCRRPLPQPHPR